MKNQYSKDSNLRREIILLSDAPLAEDYAQNDRFGHEGIADNLKRIVLSCPVPFTVGLFGKWGTGKTSILNILENKLFGEKIPVVKFDVWKHEGDALRRTFLLELVYQLKDQLYLNSDYTVSTSLNRSITTKREIEKFSLKKFIMTILGAVVFFILVGIILKWYLPESFEIYISVALSGTFVSGLLIWLFSRIIITEGITEHKDRLQDPVEFENEFERAIVNVNKECERVLISIDNVDRCMHNKAIELLSTIKTFMAKDEISLEANKCVFLIPCDDKAVKRHLEVICGKNYSIGYDTDEFLRKFFNASITIPDFIDTELQGYTKSLLEETHIQEFKSSELAFVITTAFYENPRQVKQFINTLISHFLQAEVREKGQIPLIIPPGTITKHVEFLAKFLVVRQKFPEVYKEIISNYLSPQEWGGIKLATDDFKRYHIATNMFIVNDIRPFIFLKQSKEELQLPGLHQIERALLENNSEFVESNFKNIKDESLQFRHLNASLLSLIRRYMSIKTSLINIVRCLLIVSSKLKIVFEGTVYNEISRILCDNECLKDSIYHFEPSLIFSEILSRCQQTQRDVVVNEYLSYLCSSTNTKGEETVVIKDGNSIEYHISRKLAYEIMKEFIGKLEWLEQNQKAKIKKSIEDLYASDGKFISLFDDNVNAQKDFISDSTLSKFISSESDFDIKISLIARTELLLKFREVIGAKSISSTFAKFTSIFKKENEIPNKRPPGVEIGQKGDLLNQIGLILMEFSKYAQDDNIRSESNALAEQLYQNAIQIPNINDRKIFILPCFVLINRYQISNKKHMESMVKEFFENANSESIIYAIEKSEGQDAALIDKYQGLLIKKLINDESVYEHLYPLASQQTQLKWLIDLIEKNPQRSVKKLMALDYKTYDDKSIVQSLLNKISEPNCVQNPEIYATINKMKCASDENLQNIFAMKIKELLIQPDQLKQEVGYKAFHEACAYISGSTKRDIVTAVIDWLRNPQTTDSYQPYSIKSVVLCWDILLKPSKDDYIYFLFHKLVMHKGKIEAVRLAFEMLSNISLAYDEDSKVYFEDALSAAKSDPRKDFQITIISCLLQLKSQNPTAEENQFWDKITKLQNDIQKS